MTEPTSSALSSDKEDIDYQINDNKENPKEGDDTTVVGPSQSGFHDVQEEANRLYRGKGLAPMVRASTTPLRAMALEYGADFVYTEELVDRSISQTIRTINARLGTIDYVKDTTKLSPKVQRKLEREGRPCLILRMDTKLERNKLICQLGTGEPDLALEAAQHIYPDVAAIDINMGCPKKFSISGGMGSALLSDAPRAAKIISTLRKHIPRPISCKIRLLSTPEATIDFIRTMITAGANAIAIHARTVGQDATIPADWKTLQFILQQLVPEYPNFPFLLNGDFYDRQEMKDMLETTKASGILLGRPALYNLSIFQPLSSSPLVDKKTVAQRYLQYSARYEQHFKNAKYVLCEMINNRRTPTPRVPYLDFTIDGGAINIAKTCSCTNIQQVFEVWGVQWNGMGLSALGENGVDKGQDREGQNEEKEEAVPVDGRQEVETILEPGEHRYEDAYFLKKRGIQDDEVQRASDSKRSKVDDVRLKTEEGQDQLET